MELFNGGVKEAIAEAKAKKTVFVVIVTGPREFTKNQIDKKGKSFRLFRGRGDSEA